MMVGAQIYCARFLNFYGNDMPWHVVPLVFIITGTALQHGGLF